MTDSLPGQASDVSWSEFKKSSFSGGGGCVEVSVSSRGDARVRDSKWTDSPVLSFNPTEWAAFLRGVEAGEFGRP